MDTKHVITHIRLSLALLDACMKSVQDNMTRFNTYVQGLLWLLHKRRETTYNLFVNLAKGYKVYFGK